ncbi:MAG TPA: EipA family protein [Gammaproteobacteria bacterium]
MRLSSIVAACLAMLAAGCAGQRASGPAPAAAAAPRGSLPPEPYQRDTVLTEAESFFGNGARGVAQVLNRVLDDNGPPDAYIKGEEGGGAVGVGLRYGHGTLYYKDGTSTKVYWRGPSLGFDVGGSAAKTFVLVYNLDDIDSIFQRFGGVEGSLYYVGGVGVTYNRADDIVLAPVRFGVGWRQGVNVGYMHLSPEPSWIPF